MDMYVGHATKDVNFRETIYSGALFLNSTLASARELCEYAIACAAETFGETINLRSVHKAIKVEEFARLVTLLKKRFTNSDQSKTIIRAFIREIGEDPSDYLFDVPRIRVVPTYDYLHAGVSYAYKPHRDTWYGGPPCEINTWMPLFPIGPHQTMMINPAYFSRPVKNTSATWSLADWIKERRPAAEENISEESRVHPVPLEDIDPAGEIRLAGDCANMVMFSGSHLHGTVPNLSDQIRYSVDFRLMHIDDLLAGRGARNVDSACRDAAAGYKDYFRGSDFAPFEEAVK